MYALRALSTSRARSPSTDTNPTKHHAAAAPSESSMNPTKHRKITTSTTPSTTQYATHAAKLSPRRSRIGVLSSTNAVYAPKTEAMKEKSADQTSFQLLMSEGTYASMMYPRNPPRQATASAASPHITACERILPHCIPFGDPMDWYMDSRCFFLSRKSHKPIFLFFDLLIT